MAVHYGNFSYTIQDELGVSVSDPIFFTVDDTVVLSDLVTEAGTIATKLDAITGGVIKEINIKLTGVTAPGGLKTAAIAGDDNNRIGLFGYSQAGSKYTYSQQVPALRTTLIVGERIDVTAAAITNFTNYLPAANPIVTYVSTGVHDLVAWLTAQITFRKHRKLDAAKTKELS